MAYRRCNRCIMNNAADTEISFDDKGNCNYCNHAAYWLKQKYYPNAEGKRKLEKLLAEVKKAGEGKKYDCIMGISGGLDSSYLAYLGSQWGLRVLAVHIDDGYDTEISKRNIQRLVEKTGFDYEVVVPDAEQFNALTLAYMKAGVPNIAVPQDNILFAFLYEKMKEYKIPYFFSGSNLALESIVQDGNTWKNSDVVNIREIHRLFGTKPIDKLKFYSTLEKQFDKYLFGIHTATPLDYIDYNRDRAFAELAEYCGFEYYGGKHLENALTAFIQLRWFPEKFHVDKRTWHLSSMIISGQLSRDRALQLLEEPLYDSELMRGYEKQIAQNMGIGLDELEMMLQEPGHQHFEFKTEDSGLVFRLYMMVKKTRRYILDKLGK